MKKIIRLVNESLSRGWKMDKKISSGGLFSDDTYDTRTVYTREELLKLSKEGFLLVDDAGIIALNILLRI